MMMTTGRDRATIWRVNRVGEFRVSNGAVPSDNFPDDTLVWAYRAA